MRVRLISQIASVVVMSCAASAPAHRPKAREEANVSQPLSKLNKAQLELIKRAIAKDPGWSAETYDLDSMAEWDN